MPLDGNIEKLREFDLDLPPMEHLGLIVNRNTRSSARLLDPKSEDDLYSLYQKNHALVEDAAREELFFWTAEISNSSLDSWFTRMADSSLRNYAEDAISPSVSFQDSHARNELGVGRSLYGQLVTDGTPPQGIRAEDYFPVCFADFYTVRDLKLGKMTTDDFIKGVQRGIIKDVSIGFKEGVDFQYTCSICGLDMWDWDCVHIPGYKYDYVENPEDDPSVQRVHEDVLCFAWIENARLSEVSAVYDGATTNAMIVKATREARAGRLDRNVKEFLEHRYRFTLDTKRHLWTGVDIVRETLRNTLSEPGDEQLLQTVTERLTGVNGIGKIPTKESRTMPQANNTQPGAAAAADTATTPIDYTPQFRQACVNVGVEIDENATSRQCVDALVAEITRLQPQAVELDKLRAIEITEAVAEKVRAYGDQANEESTRKMLAAADVETIRSFKGEWKQLGDKRFPGGRRSEDAGTQPGGDSDNIVDETDDERKAREAEEKRKAEETPAGKRYIPTSSFGSI